MNKESKISPSQIEQERTWSLPVTLAALGGLCVLVAVMSITKIFEDDVFWHLATGKWIWQHKIIPDKDVFGFVTQGQPWIPFEWGWDVVTYLLYAVQENYVLFQLFNVFIWLVMYLIFIVAMRKLNVSLPILLLTLLFTLFVSFTRMSPRPEVVTAFFLTLLCGLFYLYKENPSRMLKKLYFLPVMFCLWVNMHPGFLAGLVVVALFSFSEIIVFAVGRKISVKENGPNRMKAGNLKTLALISGLCLVATLVNPHGLNTILYIFAHTKMDFLKEIQEWTPPFQLKSFSVDIIFYAVSLALGCLSLFFSIKKKDPFAFLLYIVFAILSLQAVRFLSNFVVITSIGTALSWEYLLSSSWSRIRKYGDSKYLLATIGGLLLYIMINISNGSFYQKIGIDTQSGFGVDERFFPVQLKEFITKNDIKGKPFNDMSIGGWLIWELPGQMNFIDSRNLNNRIGYMYLSILNMQPGLVDTLERTGVDFMIMNISDLRRSAENMAYFPIPYCSTDRETWKLVFWDDRSFLYVKNIPKFRDVIAKYEYKIVDPYLYVFKPQEFDSLQRANPGLFESEIKRKLKEEPTGSIANFIAGQLQGNVPRK